MNNQYSSHEHLTRQLDIIPVEKLSLPITVIGAGAIGSTTVMTLAKMGFNNIAVWDFDEVSVENMNCQYYRFSDIGRPKVIALKEIIKDFTQVEIKECPFKWTPDVAVPLSGLIITAVDSMEVRKMLWDSAKNRHGVQWYIDPRMAAESALSFVMNPNDEADQISYEKTLYTDDHANKIAPERCTARSTMYTANLIAGYVAKHVKDIVTGEPYARVTHWDIRGNNLLNWPKKENKTV